MQSKNLSIQLMLWVKNRADTALLCWSFRPEGEILPPYNNKDSSR